MKRFFLTLDLQPDDDLIRQYEAYHAKVPKSIQESIFESGILNLEIHRLCDRLILFLETEDDFTFEKKKVLDDHNPAVIEWEKLMWTFQKPLPFAKNGEKWMEMSPICRLKSDRFEK
jgi:L-rhamnose mutarotase